MSGWQDGFKDKATSAVQRSKTNHARRIAEQMPKVAAERTDIKTLPAIINAPPPKLAWYFMFTTPFSYAYSKNRRWKRTKTGHVFIPKEISDASTRLAQEVSDRAHLHNVVEAKVWLDIFVEKPDHRGDAVNVVDFVCDFVKVGLGVDDRWYSIRKLDWSINRVNPHLFIGVGQESEQATLLCTNCGKAAPSLPYRNGQVCSACSDAAKGMAGIKVREWWK